MIPAMLPESRSSRRFFVGAALILVSAAASLGLRGFAKPYVPDAPDYRQKGPADAPVVIVEFSDFQCAACRHAVEPLKRIQSMFPGKIRVVFKHYPWDFHRWAIPAAVAAECAGRQGAFWKFHDRIFSQQQVWAPLKDAVEFEKKVLSYAKDSGVNIPKFEECVANPNAAKTITKDLEEAKKHWVKSTPTFFINGRRFVGALQLRTHGLNRIEDILKK